MQSTVKDVSASQPKKQRSLPEYGSLVLRGICMGASDIVPGVSGGTMAFILGIYEELIDSIRTVGRPEFLQKVFKFQIKEAFDMLNWEFLLSIAVGVLLAILTLSQGLEWLLVNQPVYLWSFFFGLVLASIITVGRRMERWTPQLVGLTVVGTVVAYVLVGAVPVQTPNAPWFLFLSGAFAICAMILPGISGSFILLILGKYQYVLSAVNNRDFVTLFFVAMGAGVGIVTFAQFLGWLFKKYHNATVAVLIGFMVGSLRKVWPWKLDVDFLRDAAGQLILDSHGEQIVIRQLNVLPDFTSGAGLGELFLALVLMGVGFGAIMLLDRVAGSKGDVA